MAANSEAVDFDDDDLMDEDGQEAEAVSAPKLSSTIIRGGGAGAGEASNVPRKIKGRGSREEAGAHRGVRFGGRDFDSLDSDGGPAPLKSTEGWIVLISGLDKVAEESDLDVAFGGFGHIKSKHLNLDRHTGYVKGYALIEYESFDEANNAIRTMNGTEFGEKTIYVDWAFSNGPYRRRNTRRRSPRRRSRSPRRRY